MMSGMKRRESSPGVQALARAAAGLPCQRKSSTSFKNSSRFSCGMSESGQAESRAIMAYDPPRNRKCFARC